MQHDAKVSARDTQDVTDVLSRKFLDLSQEKGERLAKWSGVDTREDLLLYVLVV